MKLTCHKTCWLRFQAEDPDSPWYGPFSESSKLKTQEEPVFSLEPEGKKEIVFQFAGVRQRNSPFLGKAVSLCVPFRPPTDFMRHAHIYLVYQFKH